MIVKISRGGKATGLMHYLAGPGRRNEHESPHLVAGSAGLMSWYSTDELNTSDAYRLGMHLEAPNRRFGTTVTLPVKTADVDAGQLVATGERRDAHVWHCSLSLAPGHPELHDEQWAAIAEDFIAEMEFVVQDANGEDVKAPCRWVAVHHGASVNGGDHIHIAVNLVREDGTKASTRNDYKRASVAAAKLERAHGLEVVEGREVGRSARPELMRELAAVEAGETTETPSARMARTVRACATASESEAEFVRRLRREGLWVRPRFAAGGHDVVVGFSVAERPSHGMRAEWRAAGKLGRDLTLPRLRDSWGKDTDAPTGADAHAAIDAADEWSAAWRGAPIVQAEAEPVEVTGEDLRRCASELADLNKSLTSISLRDHAAWAEAAHDASGVLAAWSLRTEQTPGELAVASDQLARAAALHRREMPERRTPVRTRSAASTALALVAAGSGGRAGQALVIRQLIVTAKALTIAADRTGQTRQLRRWNDSARRDLETVATRLEQRAVVTPGAGRPAEAQRPAPALPNELQRARERAQRGRDGRDHGR